MTRSNGEVGLAYIHQRAAAVTNDPAVINSKVKRYVEYQDGKLVPAGKPEVPKPKPTESKPAEAPKPVEAKPTPAGTPVRVADFHDVGGKELQGHVDAAWKNLSPDQKQAVSDYAGWHYASVNHLLRNEITQPQTNQQKLAAKIIPDLDKATTSWSAPRDMVVYRNCAGCFKTPVTKDLGFVSTSVSKGFAKEWGGGAGPSGTRATYKILVPKGSKALPIGHRGSKGTFEGHEGEILFPKGSRFEHVEGDTYILR